MKVTTFDPGTGAKIASPYFQTFNGAKNNIRTHLRPVEEIQRRLLATQVEVFSAEARDRGGESMGGGMSAEAIKSIRSSSVFSNDALKAMRKLITTRAPLYVLPAAYDEYIEMGTDSNNLKVYRSNGRGRALHSSTFQLSSTGAGAKARCLLIHADADASLSLSLSLSLSSATPLQPN